MNNLNDLSFRSSLFWRKLQFTSVNQNLLLYDLSLPIVTNFLVFRLWKSNLKMKSRKIEQEEEEDLMKCLNCYCFWQPNDGYFIQNLTWLLMSLITCHKTGTKRENVTKHCFPFICLLRSVLALSTDFI